MTVLTPLEAARKRTLQARVALAAAVQEEEAILLGAAKFHRGDQVLVWDGRRHWALAIIEEVVVVRSGSLVYTASLLNGNDNRDGRSEATAHYFSQYSEFEIRPLIPLEIEVRPNGSFAGSRIAPNAEEGADDE